MDKKGIPHRNMHPRFFDKMFWWFVLPIIFSPLIIYSHPDFHLLLDGDFWLAFILLLYYPAVLSIKTTSGGSSGKGETACDILSMVAIVLVYFFVGVLPLSAILKALISDLPPVIVAIVRPNMVLAYLGLIIVTALALQLRVIAAPSKNWKEALGMKVFWTFELPKLPCLLINIEESKTLIALNFIILGSFGASITLLNPTSVVTFNHVIGLLSMLSLIHYYKLDHPDRPNVLQQFKHAYNDIKWW